MDRQLGLWSIGFGLAFLLGVADGAADVGGATALGKARGGRGGSLQCAELLRQQLSVRLDGDVLRGKHPLL